MNAAAPDDVLCLVDQAVADKRLSQSAGVNLTRWLIGPAYRDYHALLVNAICEARFAELDTAFWEVLPFGTGGRRGLMSDYGTATLNPRTVAESAAGIARYLRKTTGSATGSAAVAFDTRLRSREFGQLTACTLAAYGLRVWMFDQPRATPELSFAVRYLKCDVGVMITASHNPPSDNGIKAYWSNGGQVLPPHDAGIIDEVNNVAEIPTIDFEEAVQQRLIRLIGTDLDDEYVRRVAALSLCTARDLRILFTPLHGVGESSVVRVLEEAGFRDVRMFAPQSTPDGRFPNVPGGIANPESPAVFDMAVAAATSGDIDLILASDPDADRIGAVVMDAKRGSTRLTGNQIAALMADFVIRGRIRRGDLTPEHYVVQTLVTTPLVAMMARASGLRAVDDLPVGCKYIAGAVDELGPEKFLLGCEESHGFMAGDHARDKDAAAGALYLAEAAAELKRDGLTLLDRLDALYCLHGYVGELQFSQVCTGAAGREQIARIMDAFQFTPPREFAGVTWSRVRDYGRHEVRKLPENTWTDDLVQPSTTLLIFEGLRNQTRFSLAVRPSGTEPKIKFYLFAVTDLETCEELPDIERETDRVLRTIRDESRRWMDATAGAERIAGN